VLPAKPVLVGDGTVTQQQQYHMHILVDTNTVRRSKYEEDKKLAYTVIYTQCADDMKNNLKYG
ncbi:MAG: hypothetical protein ACI90V_008071, partial [Bacillariaceae sp.]|jgi:hypothetical protein